MFIEEATRRIKQGIQESERLSRAMGAQIKRIEKLLKTTKATKRRKP